VTRPKTRSTDPSPERPLLPCVYGIQRVNNIANAVFGHLWEAECELTQITFTLGMGAALMSEPKPSP